MNASGKNSAGEREPDAIDLALPWHAVERLSPDEAARIEAALATDFERARHLAVIREERAETVALNQGLGLPSNAAHEALFARIEAERGVGGRVGLAQRFQAWLTGLSPGALAWSAAATALVMALQAGFLANIYLGPARPSYETASAPGAGAQDEHFAIVAFVGSASAEQIDTLLRSARVTIVDGPRPGGLYRIRLGERTIEAGGRDAAVDRLKAASSVIRLLAPETPPAP